MWLNRMSVALDCLDVFKDCSLDIFKNPINMTPSNCCLGSLAFVQGVKKLSSWRKLRPQSLYRTLPFLWQSPSLLNWIFPSQDHYEVWQAAVGSKLATQQLSQKLDYHFTKHYKGWQILNKQPSRLFYCTQWWTNSRPDLRLATIVTVAIWIYYYLKAWVNIDSMVLTIIRKHDLSDTMCVFPF